MGDRPSPVRGCIGDERLFQFPESRPYCYSSSPSVRPSEPFVPFPHLHPSYRLLSYPAGKFAAYMLPIATYRIPFPARLGGPLHLSLNPGPWNIKEHVLVYIMSNGELS